MSLARCTPSRIGTITSRTTTTSYAASSARVCRSARSSVAPLSTLAPNSRRVKPFGLRPLIVAGSVPSCQSDQHRRRGDRAAVIVVTLVPTPSARYRADGPSIAMPCEWLLRAALCNLYLAVTAQAFLENPCVKTNAFPWRNKRFKVIGKFATPAARLSRDLGQIFPGHEIADQRSREDKTQGESGFEFLRARHNTHYKVILVDGESQRLSQDFTRNFRRARARGRNTRVGTR